MPKHVLITGGTGGIGKALVLAFSAAGYRVSFTYNISSESTFLAEHTGASKYCVNFEDPLQVSDFADRIVSEAGPVDILINNAGIAHYGLIQDVTQEEFQRLFAINFQSPFFLTQRLLSHMIAKQSGVIINIASVWGEAGASCEVLYSSAKGAMISFTKALAKELAPSNIVVNCISPGVVDTAMMASFSDEEKAAIAQDIPAGCFTSPDEIAKLALYLSEHSSTSLTGQIIGMNGGMYC